MCAGPDHKVGDTTLDCARSDSACSTNKRMHTSSTPNALGKPSTYRVVEAMITYEYKHFAYDDNSLLEQRVRNSTALMPEASKLDGGKWHMDKRENKAKYKQGYYFSLNFIIAQRQT